MKHKQMNIFSVAMTIEWCSLIVLEALALEQVAVVIRKRMFIAE